MEAMYNNYSNEEILESDSENEVAKCQALLSFKPKNKTNNTAILIWINEFHKCLDDAYESGVKINHLGKEIVFYIDHIAHQNQSMIYFKGHTEKGKLVHFVKPSSQLNITLKALTRRCPDIPKSPFGFTDWEAFEKVKNLND